MKLHIEIVRADHARAVLYRKSMDGISPRRAKAEAAALSARHVGRGANSARMLNDKNEELYKL